MATPSDFGRGAAGIHTVEGVVAGGRAARLAAEREAAQKAFEEKKAAGGAAAARAVRGISDRFAAKSNELELQFRNATVGLVTAEQFEVAQKTLEKQAAALMAGRLEREQAEERARLAKQRANAAAAGRGGKGKPAAAHKRSVGALSFDLDEVAPVAAPATAGVGGGGGAAAMEAPTAPVSAAKRPAVFKDPTVETSFLPDREREAQLEAEKERLRRQWLAEQEEVKKEKLEVTYSYWDGSGHRRKIVIEKGVSIGKFLELVIADLIPEFPELRSATAESMLYIKEDLIIPQQYSFYDLILRKARGKSGPLFHFDVHDDVRLINDSRVEKEDSHPGKIVERRWYEANKHIFPAKRWEVYDPSVSYDKYTIAGSDVH